jgi:hypothetical protein
MLRELLFPVVVISLTDSLLAGLMKVKDTFFQLCRRCVGNGKETRFQEDLWIGNKPLCTRFARLYNYNMWIRMCWCHMFLVKFGVQ